MPAGRYNPIIEQGADFRRTLTLTYDGVPISLVGSTLRSDIKKNVTDTNVMASFTINILDAVNGQFEIVLTHTETAALEAGDAFYDLEWETPGAEVIRLLEGVIKITPEVTR